LSGSDSRSPLVSPLFADLRGLPPLLIHVGQLEVLVDQVVDFAQRARAAGVDVRIEVYEDMVHVWHMLSAFTPRAKEAIDDIAHFVEANSEVEVGRAKQTTAD
jgi:acetyl esterase/lipase